MSRITRIEITKDDVTYFFDDSDEPFTSIEFEVPTRNYFEAIESLIWSFNESAST